MVSERAGAATVFAGSLALRLLHLQQVVANDPFYAQPSVDSRVYRDWALRIAAGDWLGSEPFFLSPLYGYLLALVYRLTGPGHFWPLALNALFGACACALAFLIAARLFGRGAGVAAALLAALYPLAIFYEGAALLEATQTLLTTALALAALRALDAPSYMRFAAVGAVLGLSVLARQNMVLYAPLFALCALFASATTTRRLAQRAALVGVFLIALCATLAPATLRNRWVSGDFVLVNATGGLLLYDSWNRSASSTYSIPDVFPRALADDPIERKAAYTALAERALGRAPLAASEISAHWRGEAFAFVREHPERALQLALERARLFWNRFEPWDVRSFTVSRGVSWVTSLPLPGFGLIAPLALTGIALSAARWRRLAPLYGLILVYFASGVLFVSLSRYRVPVVPLLAVFAGAALARLWDFARKRDARRLAIGAALVVAAAVAVNWREPNENLSMAHYNLGNAYKEQSRWQPAIEQYQAALAEDPAYLSTWNNLGLVYERSGADRALAVQAWERLLALARLQGSGLHVERAERHLRELGRPPAR
jgi:4-amino-4-deoxy-L-arabinose transferase-like glycosyltransferase